MIFTGADLELNRTPRSTPLVASSPCWVCLAYLESGAGLPRTEGNPLQLKPNCSLKKSNTNLTFYWYAIRGDTPATCLILWG